uniref:Secreted protein n=1 Tax=Achlya hypogyna TaxID=1202772 RepID=A0A0A7CP14_ACHHY|nr:secreted protein [Achlya hypogyna]
MGLWRMLLLAAVVVAAPTPTAEPTTADNGLRLCRLMDVLDSYFVPFFDECMADSDMTDLDFLESATPPSLEQLTLFFESSACKSLYKALLGTFTEDMPLCAIDQAGTSIRSLGDLSFEELRIAILVNNQDHRWMDSYNY